MFVNFFSTLANPILTFIFFREKKLHARIKTIIDIKIYNS